MSSKTFALEPQFVNSQCRSLLSKLMQVLQPVGPLRFAKPAPPANVDGIQKGDYGPACAQSVPISMLAGPGALASIGEALGNLVDLGTLASGAKETGEDCLFLDVFVPGMLVSLGREFLK